MRWFCESLSTDMFDQSSSFRIGSNSIRGGSFHDLYMVNEPWLIRLMARFLHQLIGSLSHYSQGFYTSQVVSRNSFIKSKSPK